MLRYSTGRKSLNHPLLDQKLPRTNTTLSEYNTHYQEIRTKTLTFIHIMYNFLFL